MDVQEVPAFPSQGQVRAFSWLVNLVNAITLDMRGFIGMWNLSFMVVLEKNMKDMWWGFDALGVLVERWHPHTHMFVFQGFEASVLLEEVEWFLGWRWCLEYDVTTPLLLWEEILANIVQDKKEVLRMTNKHGIFLDRLAWWLIQHAKEIGGERATHGFDTLPSWSLLVPHSGDFLLYEHVGILSLLWCRQCPCSAGTPLQLAHHDEPRRTHMRECVPTSDPMVRGKQRMLQTCLQPAEEEENTGEESMAEEVEVGLAAMDAGVSAPEGEEIAGDGEGEETEAEALGRHQRRPKGKGRMRSRVTWDLCWAWYRALLEAQQTRVARMGFGHLLAVRPFHVDVSYLEALRERAGSGTGEEGLLRRRSRVVGARVCGREEETDLKHLARITVRGCGTVGREEGTLETLDEFYAGVRRSFQPGDRSEERSVRIFMTYFFGRLLFATQSSQMNCKFVLLLRDLEQARRYAWGTTMLGHLFLLLPSSSRRSQSTGGFTPFLQIWGYTHFPMGRGVQAEGSQAMVPLMARWEVASDPRVTDRHVEDVRAALDHYPHEQVVWTPYWGEADASHSAVAAGCPLFDHHLLLMCLGMCEPLYLELVVRTLGWHQSTLKVPSLGREGNSLRRFFSEERDWGKENGSTVVYWREGGEQVLQHTGLQDSAAYLADYRVLYVGRLRLDRRVMSEMEAVRLMEGRLAEQSVEMERLRADIRTLVSYYGPRQVEMQGQASPHSHPAGTSQSGYRRP
ncbi:hypothetical protein Taro_003287 [Colocasia esculenta]|uniref:Aminotransferase-like plant mobile domain-containing protein n=1 Tax=Colocasia esculenta TaxID=4460 RepID=A0A843TN84_COLES|nr:hypothetical protein [Colocasia esculenta]